MAKQIARSEVQTPVKFKDFFQSFILHLYGPWHGTIAPLSRNLEDSCEK